MADSRQYPSVGVWCFCISQSRLAALGGGNIPSTVSAKHSMVGFGVVLRLALMPAGHLGPSALWQAVLSLVTTLLKNSSPVCCIWDVNGILWCNSVVVRSAHLAYIPKINLPTPTPPPTPPPTGQNKRSVILTVLRVMHGGMIVMTTVSPP